MLGYNLKIITNMQKLKQLTKALLVVTTPVLLLAPVLAQTTYTYSSSDSAGGGVISLIILLCSCIYFIIALGSTVYLIVDAFKRDFGNDSSMKIISILLLIFLSFPIGTLIYYFLVMNKYPKK